ncbi:MAG: type III pantothenate kinase [Desulfosalsimonadaceae bacterium]|nr:type III pantothenate kinase [Desulfosalsimonadaceae bacterium]
MLLAVDVGNTNIVIGLFDNDRLVCDWRIRTVPGMTEDEFNIKISSLFSFGKIDPADIRMTVVSCVVPAMMKIIDGYCRRFLGHAPRWIDASAVDMPVLYDNPEEVGADRLVNAVAAYHRYRTSLIVIDFGTATTFDAITHAGEYIGGAIAPGIGIASEALFQRASKLPRVELFQPPATVIGKTTVHSMKSGIIFGYAEMVDGMVRRMKQEMQSPEPRVIATGGLAPLMRDVTTTIESVESGLTLEGLLIISRRF